MEQTQILTATETQIKTLNSTHQISMTAITQINLRTSAPVYVNKVQQLVQDIVMSFSEYNSEYLLTVGFSSKQKQLIYFFHKSESDRDIKIQNQMEFHVTFGRLDWSSNKPSFDKAPEMNFVFRSLFGYMTGHVAPFSLTSNFVKLPKKFA